MHSPERVGGTRDYLMAWMLLALVLSAEPANGCEVVVVCRPAMRSALVPWVEYRQGQGYRLRVIEPSGTADEVLRQVRQAASPASRFVVLVGDADAAGGAIGAGRESSCVPTHYCKATVNVRFGSEPTLATDGPYGDLDGDGAPDAAVGRFSADTAEQLRTIVEKTLVYERSGDLGPWRRTIHCVAGVGGFGRLLDGVLESSVQYFLTETVPPAYRVTMTYAAPGSPFCPPLDSFPQAAAARFNEGGWFWVYMGHGRPEGLDWVRTPAGMRPILDRPQVAQYRATAGAPLAVFLACYSGAFDADDCLGEEMLRAAGGPAAVIGASRVAMPYGMASLAVGLLDEVFVRQTPTVGEALLHARQALLQHDSADDPRRKLLDAIAAGLSPARDSLRTEREEHAAMFHLLGDPLLHLRHPLPLPLQVAVDEAAPGSELIIRGVAPCAGRLRLEAAPMRGRVPRDLKRRTTDGVRGGGNAGVVGPQSRGDLQQAVYEQVNASGRVVYDSSVAAGEFQLVVPYRPGDDQWMIGFLQGDARFAVGATRIGEQPRTATAPRLTR